MTWAQVFGALDAWTITGVTVVDFANVPERVAAADCPILFPVFAEFAGSRGEPQGFALNKGQDVMVIDHTCLYKPLGLGKIQEVTPQLVALMDLYWAELAGDPTAGGYLAEKMTIQEKFFPKISWGGIYYWGFAVRLKLTIRT